jgi:hypothetical protein
MEAHGVFVAALFALTAVVQVGQHSAPVDRLANQLASPQQSMTLPVCNDVELSVACMSLADIPPDLDPSQR